MKKSSPRITPASLLITATALFAASPAFAVDYTWNATTGNWDVASNWLPNTGTPGSADNVTFNTGTSASTNGNRTITNLNATNAANFSLLFTANNILTLNGGLAKSGAGTFTIGADGTASTVALGGASTWNISAGTVELRNNTVLSGSTTATLTKTGAGSLSLRGNSTNFNGGIVLEAGTIFSRTASTNTNLGSATNSKFTFQNVSGASAANILTFDAGASATIANAVVNNNAVGGAAAVARINMGSGTANRVLTLSGNFTTGAGVASDSRIQFSAIGGSTAANNNENRVDLSGDWSGYTGATAGGVWLAGARGTLQINAQQSIAPSAHTYSIAVNDSATLGNGTTGDGVTPLSGKLVLNGAFSMANAVTFVNQGAGNANSFGSRNAAGTTAVLSGTLTQNDAKAAIGSISLGGANVFSQNDGATLNLSGDIAGASLLTINSRYSYQTGTGVTMQTPVGTVQLSKADGVSFTGSLRAVNGTLLLTNTSGSATGTGSVQIDADATLAGTGIINASASNRTILINGKVAPGLAGAVGNLTLGANNLAANGVSFGSTAATTLQVASDVSFDTLTFTSNTTLGGGLSFSFGSALPSGSYDFLLGAGSLAGNFSSVAATTGGAYEGSFVFDVADSRWELSSGGTDLAFNPSTGVLSVTAIPEASSFAILAGFGALGFAAFRRRR